MKHGTPIHATTIGAAALLLAALSAPVAAQSPAQPTAKAELKDAGGKDVGSAELTQTPAGVLMKLSLTGLPPGELGFHVHAVGKCEPPFESAGAHFNPGNQHHGMMAGEGHAGDMPNLHIPRTGGDFSVELINAAVTLEKGKPNSLLDADGSSLVIHATKDDYRTDPSGNSGGRIACGVIMEQSGTVGRTGK
jgi:Cu-Zn family superoxide dismutase